MINVQYCTLINVTHKSIAFDVPQYDVHWCTCKDMCIKPTNMCYLLNINVLCLSNTDANVLVKHYKSINGTCEFEIIFFPGYMFNKYYRNCKFKNIMSPVGNCTHTLEDVTICALTRMCAVTDIPEPYGPVYLMFRCFQMVLCEIMEHQIYSFCCCRFLVHEWHR
jgi:hypothetical protein